MKILRTIETFYPFICGPTNQAYQISKRLLKKNISSTILTTYCDVDSSLPARELYHGVPVYRYKNIIQLMRYCVSPGMVKAFKDFDLIHSHNYRNFQSDTGGLFSKLKKRPFVLNTHGSLLGYLRYLPTRLSMIPYQAYDLFTFKATAKAADKIIVSSQFEYRDALEFGIKKEKIDIIPVGIDIINYQTNRFDSPKDYIELLFVGRVARNRKLEVIIQALSRLDQSFKLKVVGEEVRTSSTTRPGYFNDLNKLIDELNLKNRIEFTGLKVGEELQQCYKKADIFVFTSLYESFGQPILEAAAAGLPIVSTPTGVANDLVLDNQTGFLVNPDPEEIAKKISLLKDQNVRKQFGNQIQKLVKSHFSWDAIIEQYNYLYLELLE